MKNTYKARYWKEKDKFGKVNWNWETEGQDSTGQRTHRNSGSATRKDFAEYEAREAVRRHRAYLKVQKKRRNADWTSLEV